MESGNVICVQRYHSPCGDLMLGSFEGRLCLCDWAIGERPDFIGGRLRRVLKAGIVDAPSDTVCMAFSQLDEYFKGVRREFDIPLLFAGTGFQKKIWDKIQEIPYGGTVSYGELAMMAGMPSAVRATANAVGANAISVFVPCHRVIGGDGSLTGYAGGLAAKKMLIELESGCSICF